MPSDSMPGAFFVLAFAKDFFEHACIARSRGTRAMLARGKGRGDATVRDFARLRRGAWVPRCRPWRDATP